MSNKSTKILMALHFTLNPLFESMSGVVSRRRLPDGRVETIVATKKGTIYKRTTYPKGTFSGRS